MTREIDEDERRDAIDHARAWRRATTCRCGYPDWPGSCPGPAACPVYGEGDEDEEAAAA